MTALAALEGVALGKERLRVGALEGNGAGIALVHRCVGCPRDMGADLERVTYAVRRDVVGGHSDFEKQELKRDLDHVINP